MVSIISFESGPYNRRRLSQDPCSIVCTDRLWWFSFGLELFGSVAFGKSFQIVECSLLNFLRNQNGSGSSSFTFFGSILPVRSFPRFETIPVQTKRQKSVPIHFHLARH